MIGTETQKGYLVSGGRLERIEFLSDRNLGGQTLAPRDSDAIVYLLESS